MKKGYMKPVLRIMGITAIALTMAVADMPVIYYMLFAIIITGAALVSGLSEVDKMNDCIQNENGGG